MRWKNLFKLSEPVTPEKPDLSFKLYERFTEKPRAPYTIFGYGTINRSKNVATHYLRLRPYLGGRDPVLAQGVPDRGRIARAIFAAEKDPDSLNLWKGLFSPNPTHVLRIGWKYTKTGKSVDLLYIALSFEYGYPKHSTKNLAQACGNQLVNQLQLETYFSVLCPPPDKIQAAQMFWLALLFIRFRWLVRDRYLVDGGF